ncbi:MAG: SDR family oxidoreductase [Roseicyclus sp.]|nr:SDR family oxidoreductase [Roseicyclus sp.]MBO6625022.1 SDR family oxidoreductase [Roseicyclus sp.]MBO6923310.1 SDR family oxidoreductase [Roseicyclus sp.]
MDARSHQPVSTHRVFQDRFEGKTALVTGGASGMGRAQALRLAAEGARVAILDRNKSGAEEVAHEIAALGAIACAVAVDLSDVDAVESALETAKASLGPAQLLFNNAGIVLVKPYVECTEDDFDRLMAVNVKSTFMVTRRVIPQMIAEGGGAIVLMSSVSSMRGFALEALYGVSKAAVQAMMMNIAVEYRQDNIRCNAVCPAFVRTPHGLNEIKDFQALGFDWSDDDLAATQLRICEPEEVADVALFLASDDARFVNGEAVVVDNGWLAKA